MTFQPIPHDDDCYARRCFTFCSPSCDCGADETNEIIKEVTEGFARDLAEILPRKDKR